MRWTGAALLAALAVIALAAAWVAPNPPEARFEDLLYAPPTRLHLFGERLAAPHIHPWRLVNRLERRFAEERAVAVPLRWVTGSGLVTSGDPRAPLLLLGADGYGRDVFSRLLHGARVTLALACLATLLATGVGVIVGGWSGYAGGAADAVLSRLSELVLVLPAIYVALALRAVMPLVVPPGVAFATLTTIFAALGWPIVARGVRAVVLAEREREYVAAARAAGAGPLRLVACHLVPAARGFILTQASLLVPAFVLAEATLSFVGFGFPDTIPTWGTMLQESANVSLVADAPWLLAPAGAIFLVVLAVNLLVQGSGRPPVQLEP